MRDWKKNFEEFLKKNYELIEEHEKKCLIRYQADDELCPVFGLRIYKAKALNSLPEELLKVIKDDCHWPDSFIGLDLRRTFFNNIDYGIWDAVYGYRYVKESVRKWTMEVYVSSILRRPFTETQRNYYSTNCFEPSFYRRLLVMYDSSKFDMI